MFVIELTYNTDLATIDAHMAAHVRFLKKYYAAGHFLVSGRKIPRERAKNQNCRHERGGGLARSD
jgi:uncharacterized protein YciI